jgi:hypothetical protein
MFSSEKIIPFLALESFMVNRDSGPSLASDLLEPVTSFEKIEGSAVFLQLAFFPLR